ncbi:MAG: alkaline phosphatase [Ilumatobacter sp.]|nr:alkaline phosphatase [Ilumatobacter sp.]
MQMSRRRFLALSATFVAGCTTSEGAGSDTTLSPTTASPASTSTSTTSTTSTSTTSTSTTSTTTTTEPEPELEVNPFTLGVASGDPEASSVVLWTRLTGDLPSAGVTVEWRATATGGTEVARGEFTTGALLGGAVRVIADIDQPVDYQFFAGGWASPVGRTAPLVAADELRIASASCQHFESGFYAAHRDLAEWAPDLVLFLGDFIYEGDARPIGDDRVRAHEGPEPTDVAGYRARYATYLGDPQLQSARAAAPWICIWDDHEVENNYAGLVSEDDADVDVFARRRADAYRAWWENMPTRLPPPEGGVDFEIYRGTDVPGTDGADLLRLSMLDGRQFRSDQVCETTFDLGPPCAGSDDPARTMLGAAQEAWIADRFASTAATWNCVAQQTVLSDLRFGDVGAILNYDQWDGYAPARDRLLAAPPSGLVVLTGDIHLGGVGLVGPLDAPVGVEFVTTSISSAGNVPVDFAPVVEGFENIVAADLVHRGYTRHTVTQQAWTAEYRTVDDITDPESAVSTWRTFTVPAGAVAVTGDP